MYRILIVEDDLTIGTMLGEHLGKWGFATSCVTDFTNVTAQFLAVEPHLVLLDISLPFYNGYYWCGELRKLSAVPILFLSSHTETMDLVMAVNMGGDDYITKPFEMEVLIAKINALLRRTYDYYKETQTLSIRGALLQPADGTLQFEGQTVELTRNEAKIMLVLLERKNTIVSREDLMKKLWDNDSFVDDNTLTVNVNRLRKKLEDLGLQELIRTKKGLGYLIHD